MEKMTVSQAKKAISDKLSHFFGVDTKTATDAQYYKAVALIVRDRLSQMNSDFRHEAKGQDSKEIYYLCMEFLMGRSLKNNLYNLDLTDTFKKALESFDVSLDKLYEKEPDAGLGNGGLGRLAACYLDGLATNGFQSMGYSIRYEAGIFSKSLLTAGRLNFLISGFRAVMFGLFRVMKEVLKLSLKVGLMKAGTVISTMLITEIATL